MELPRGIERMLQRLREEGHAACLAGGCVRDACMGKKPHDYDIATSALPEEIVRKVACVGCSALLSVSAPTSLGVRAAEEEGILLAGCGREDRFNVYTFPERIRDVSGEN